MDQQNEVRSNILPEEKPIKEPQILPTEFISVENWKPAPEVGVERARFVCHAQRQGRYEQVMKLRALGLTDTEIASRVGITTRTLRPGLTAGDIRVYCTSQR